MSSRGDDNNVGDAGGGDAKEISLSVEETNKLRASLGLPPLKETSEKDRAAAEEHKKRKRAEEEAAKASELEERVKSARERRKQQELLANTKTLGEAEPEVDDVMAWVSKSRKIAEDTKEPPAKARRSNRKSAAAAKGDSDGKGEAELAGVKVKFGVDDLEAGEEMILTLEDRGILDDKGHLIEDDEGVALENVLRRENKQRAKAFKDARKTAKPLWEEDGQRRSILDKYDEEEEEAFHLDDAGALEASKLKRQDDIRAKLEAAKAGAVSAGDAAVPGAGTGGGDYYTPEEMAAMRKPKKKKERKLKKKALTADELAALEEAAAAAGGEDLGSRADRERRAAERSAALIAETKEKRSRFDAALSKANYASLALKEDGPAAEEQEEEDEDLYRSLQKARELAAKKAEPQEKSDSIAELLIKRREANGSANGPAAGSLAGLTFTDIGEFTRGITVKEDLSTVPVVNAAGEVKAEAVEMEVEPVATLLEKEEEIPMPMEEDSKAEDAEKNDGAWGSWLPAAEATAAAEKEKEKQTSRKNYRRRAEENEAGPSTNTGVNEAEVGVTSESAMGRGVGAALAFLKERGELKQPVEWAGRTKDHTDSYFTRAMGGYKDLYTGGRSEDRLAQDVEVALTKKDEFGRILTPKEAFRRLCHDFHGIKPSKSSIEKRNKQIEKEMAQRKAATGAVDGTLVGMKAVQEAAATPYIALSGTVKPGQSRDAASGFATVDRGEAARPKLGGGQSPLMGNAKVEAMLGMMPPPPRPPQQQGKKGKK